MTWEEPLIFKEITNVYIVNHKKFFTRKEAEDFVKKLRKKHNAK